MTRPAAQRALRAGDEGGHGARGGGGDRVSRDAPAVPAVGLRPSALVERALRAVRRAVCLPIRLYQRYVSPAFPDCCRYTPSCSEYAAQAIERYGVLRGCLKGMLRLMRCHPLGGSGYDPVD